MTKTPETTDDNAEDGFQWMFNDPLPPKEDAPEAIAPNLDALPASAEVEFSRSPNLTPSHVASQKLAAQRSSSSPKDESKAVRNMAHAAALRESSTRLGDFTAPMVEAMPSVKTPAPPKPKARPRVKPKAKPTASQPPPLPPSAVPPPLKRSQPPLASAHLTDLEIASLSKDALDKALDKVSPRTWKALGATPLILLLCLIFRCYTSFRQPYRTLESELPASLNQKLSDQFSLKTVHDIVWNENPSRAANDNSYTGTITYSDYSESYLTVTVEGWNILGRPNGYKYEVTPKEG